MNRAQAEERLREILGDLLGRMLPCRRSGGLEELPSCRTIDGILRHAEDYTGEYVRVLHPDSGDVLVRLTRCRDGEFFICVPSYEF